MKNEGLYNILAILRKLEAISHFGWNVRLLRLVSEHTVKDKYDL